MTGGTGTVTEEGIKIEIMADIRRRAAGWRSRGTRDGAPNERPRTWPRTWMRDIGCRPCGMGAGPRRHPNSTCSSKVRPVHGRTALTVEFLFLVLFCASLGF